MVWLTPPQWMPEILPSTLAVWIKIRFLSKAHGTITNPRSSDFEKVIDGCVKRGTIVPDGNIVGFWIIRILLPAITDLDIYVVGGQAMEIFDQELRLCLGYAEDTSDKQLIEEEG